MAGGKLKSTTSPKYCLNNHCSFFEQRLREHCSKECTGETGECSPWVQWSQASYITFFAVFSIPHSPTFFPFYF